MKEPIDPIAAGLRLAQLLGEEPMMPAAPSSAAPAPAAASGSIFTGNPFEDILTKAVEALEGVSKSEIIANQKVDQFIKGEADLQEVMVAQAKMSIMVQMAVTTINSAVNTLKEITQMQV